MEMEHKLYFIKILQWLQLLYMLIQIENFHITVGIAMNYDMGNEGVLT